MLADTALRKSSNVLTFCGHLFLPLVGPACIRSCQALGEKRWRLIDVLAAATISAEPRMIKNVIECVQRTFVDPKKVSPNPRRVYCFEVLPVFWKLE